MALLVLAAIPDPRWGLLYLMVFGAGTIAGMMVTTAATAVPFAYTADRMVRVNGVLAAGSGMLSLVFGALVLYDLGMVKGLFGSHPVWVPR